MGLNDEARRWRLRLFGARRTVSNPWEGEPPARVAQWIFDQDMGGSVPPGRPEMMAMVRRSGAELVTCAGLPAGLSGLHARGTIYVSEALARPLRRRVLMQLWARYLCWRDRGGPPVSVYADDPGGGPYDAVAREFTEIVRRADPVQACRERTLY